MSSLNSDRPLSPHLQVYNLPMTARMSILHRASGVALSIGTIMVVWLLVAVAMGAEAYECYSWFVGTIIGKLMLFGWSAALFYHMCNGVRHMFWDMGYLFKLENAAKSGWLVLILAAVLTAFVWCPVAFGESEPVTEEVQACEKMCEGYDANETGFSGDRTCVQLWTEEGPCSLPHVTCTQAPEMIKAGEE